MASSGSSSASEGGTRGLKQRRSGHRGWDLNRALHPVVNAFRRGSGEVSPDMSRRRKAAASLFTPFTTTVHDERQGYVSLQGVMQPSIRSMLKGRFCFGREVDGGWTTQYDVELKYRMDTFSHELHTLFFISIVIPLLLVATGIVVLTDRIADGDELLSSFWGDLYPVALAAVFVLVLVPVGVMFCRSKPRMALLAFGMRKFSELASERDEANAAARTAVRRNDALQLLWALLWASSGLAMGGVIHSWSQRMGTKSPPFCFGGECCVEAFASYVWAGALAIAAIVFIVIASGMRLVAAAVFAVLFMLGSASVPFFDAVSHGCSAQQIPVSRRLASLAMSVVLVAF